VRDRLGYRALRVPVLQPGHVCRRLEHSQLDGGRRRRELATLNHDTESPSTNGAFQYQTLEYLSHSINNARVAVDVGIATSLQQTFSPDKPKDKEDVLFETILEFVTMGLGLATGPLLKEGQQRPLPKPCQTKH
jgi:hypothetical protein